MLGARKLYNHTIKQASLNYATHLKLTCSPQILYQFQILISDGKNCGDFGRHRNESFRQQRPEAWTTAQTGRVRKQQQKKVTSH